MNKEINIEDLIAKNKHPLLDVLEKAMTARTDTYIESPMVIPDSNTAVWHNAKPFGVEQPLILSGTTGTCNLIANWNDSPSLGGVGGNISICAGNRNGRVYSCAQSQRDFMNYIHGLLE